MEGKDIYNYCGKLYELIKIRGGVGVFYRLDDFGHKIQYKDSVTGHAIEGKFETAVSAKIHIEGLLSHKDKKI